MTPGIFKWLLKLRDEGPQQRPRVGSAPMLRCNVEGLTKWQSTGAAECITDAGREALDRAIAAKAEEQEAKAKKLEARAARIRAAIVKL